MFSDVGRRSVKRETCGKYANAHIHTQERDDRTKIYESFLIKRWCVDIAFAIVSMSCEKFALNIDLHHLCRFARLAVPFARGKEAEKEWQDEDGENRIFHRVNGESSTHAGNNVSARKSRVNGFPLFAFYVLFTYDESQILSARAK